MEGLRAGRGVLGLGHGGKARHPTAAGDLSLRPGRPLSRRAAPGLCRLCLALAGVPWSPLGRLLPEALVGHPYPLFPRQPPLLDCSGLLPTPAVLVRVFRPLLTTCAPAGDGPVPGVWHGLSLREALRRDLVMEGGKVGRNPRSPRGPLLPDTGRRAPGRRQTLGPTWNSRERKRVLGGGQEAEGGICTRRSGLGTAWDGGRLREVEKRGARRELRGGGPRAAQDEGLPDLSSPWRWSGTWRALPD